MWFEALTGFREISPEQVRENISVCGKKLKSLINGREFICGNLEIPSLRELRERIKMHTIPAGNISVKEVVANIRDIHCNSSNAGSLIQVASQFNLLEMASPSVTPEDGVGIYEYDHTQGPACAIAAGAGTVYRNYFVDVNGRAGQTAGNQIDCLSDLGKALGNSDNHLWEMKNGYALATKESLQEITNKLRQATEPEIDQLRRLVRIGIQWDTEVTIADSRHTLSQAFCSALPIAYSSISPTRWSEFAKLILDATYEATLCAGILNYMKTGNNKVFLTLVGGGAFGNDISWIMDAIHRALKLYRHVGLDVIIVSYGYSNTHIQNLIAQF